MEREYIFNEQIRNISLSNRQYIYEQLVNIYANENPAILSEEGFYSYIDEGANVEYTKIFVDRFKNIRELSSKGKKYFKSSDFKNAKISYTQASNECKKLYSDFDKVDDTVLSTVIGIILDMFISSIPLIISCLMVEYIAAIIIVTPAALATAVQEILEIVTLIKDWKDDDIVKNLNFYRNKLKSGIKLLDGCYIKKIKQCEEAIKKQK